MRYIGSIAAAGTAATSPLPMTEEEAGPDWLHIGLLGAAVIGIVAAIYILRRRKRGRS